MLLQREKCGECNKNTRKTTQRIKLLVKNANFYHSISRGLIYRAFTMKVKKKLLNLLYLTATVLKKTFDISYKKEGCPLTITIILFSNFNNWSYR